MLKRLLVILICAQPFLAQAHCSFDASTQTLEVRTRPVAEAKYDCNITSNLNSANAAAQATAGAPYRRSNTEKLRSFTDLKKQAEYLSNADRYYGQR